MSSYVYVKNLNGKTYCVDLLSFMVKCGKIKRNGGDTFMGRKRTYHIFLSDDEKKLLHSTINNKL